MWINTRRHNDVCGIIHQQIALNLGLLQDWKPYYRYVPVQVLENEHYLLYWDRTIQADRLVVRMRHVRKLITRKTYL